MGAMRDTASPRRSRTSAASTGSSDDDVDHAFVPTSRPTLLAGSGRRSAASSTTDSAAAAAAAVAAAAAAAAATAAYTAGTSTAPYTKLADVRLHARDAERVRRTTLPADYLDDERRAVRWAREYRDAVARGTELPVCPAPRVNGKPVGTLLEFMLHLVLGSVLGVIGYAVSAVMASSHASRAGGLTGVGLLLIFGGSWVGVVAGTTHAPMAGAALVACGVFAAGYALLHMRAVLQLVDSYTRSRQALVDDLVQ